MINTAHKFGDFVLKTEIEMVLDEEDVSITFDLYYENSHVYSISENGTLISLGDKINKCQDILRDLANDISNAQDVLDLIDLSIEWKFSFNTLKILTNYLQNK